MRPVERMAVRAAVASFMMIIVNVNSNGNRRNLLLLLQEGCCACVFSSLGGISGTLYTTLHEYWYSPSKCNEGGMYNMW